MFSKAQEIRWLGKINVQLENVHAGSSKEVERYKKKRGRPRKRKEKKEMIQQSSHALKI